MATSHTAIVIVTLLMLASSPSLVHARTMPRDHPHAHDASASSSRFSQNFLRVFKAPPAPLVLTDKLEIAAAERRQIIEATADGSVPSPGIGHHH
ncbi:hypothetical protein HU200_020101 [Digitaria exilis]|uniref:Uncharacterized protein n=1 Tax=Digitaria exilis TaxID=1010633 RepID=A0A835F1A2_9POAL|nr:hypothetical protein HU200_020101 [Digitaria exilis]CAB3463545.1 unnamed protein product [Digitaria exilis]